MAWTQLKDNLENSYLASRSIKASSSYRSFLCRCRTLERFLHIGCNRVNGLKVLLFAPKLRAHYCTTLKTQRERHILEMELKKSGLISNIEKAVDLRCRDWLNILMKAYPDHIVPFTIGQTDDIKRALSENVNQQVEVNSYPGNEIFKGQEKIYQPGKHAFW